MRNFAIYYLVVTLIFLSNTLSADSRQISYEDVPYYDPKTRSLEVIETTETPPDSPSEDASSNENKDSESKEEEKEDEKDDEDKENKKCPKCDIVVFGDFLWWNVRKCHLDYAININEGTGVVSGNVHAVHPKWNTGFRLGVARSCEELEYGVIYTHFGSATTASAFKNGSGGIKLCATRLNTGYSGDAFDLFEYASSKYHVDLNLVDFEAGFAPEIDEKTKLRVFGGLRLAYIDQKLRSRYSDETNGEDSDRPLDLYDVFDVLNQKIDMDAYGLYFGGGGGKTFCGNFGLWGRAAFGAYVGRFDRSLCQLGKDYCESVTQVWVDLKDRCYRVVSSIELAVGLEYRFCKKGPCCSNWLVKAGYEFNHFFNTCDFMNLIKDSTDNQHQFDRNTDSIGFDGLVIRLVGIF